ncbi:MAG TPA: hypothetical protein VJS63_14295 [Bradyrhizobium sp.]|nr:hypothetical protein [Bradyrhizobium sp.]
MIKNEARYLERTAIEIALVVEFRQHTIRIGLAADDMIVRDQQPRRDEESRANGRAVARDDSGDGTGSAPAAVEEDDVDEIDGVSENALRAFTGPGDPAACLFQAHARARLIDLRAAGSLRLGIAGAAGRDCRDRIQDFSLDLGIVETFDRSLGNVRGSIHHFCISQQNYRETRLSKKSSLSVQHKRCTIKTLVGDGLATARCRSG